VQQQNPVTGVEHRNIPGFGRALLDGLFHAVQQ